MITGYFFLCFYLFTTFFDMRNIAMGLDDLLGWISRISLVCTEVLFGILWRQDNTLIKDCFQLRYIMPVRSGYDYG